ncbi:hypothetical protein L195_g063210, partial [Trifolium pratense]
MNFTDEVGMNLRLSHIAPARRRCLSGPRRLALACT